MLTRKESKRRRHPHKTCSYSVGLAIDAGFLRTAIREEQGRIAERDRERALRRFERDTLTAAEAQAEWERRYRFRKGKHQ